MDNLFQNIKNDEVNNPLSKAPDGAWNEFSVYRAQRDSKKGISWMGILLTALGLLLLTSNIYWWNSKSQTVTHLETHSVDTLYVVSDRGSYDMQNHETDQRPLGDEHERMAAILAELRESNNAIYRLENKLSWLEGELIQSKQNHQLLGTRYSSSLFGPSSKQGGSGFTQWNSFVDEKASYLNPMNKRSLDLMTSLNNERTIHDEAYDRLDNWPVILPKKNIFQTLKPKSLTVLAQGGLSYATNTRLGSFIGGTYGLGLETKFSDHLRLSVGLELTSSSGEIDDDERFAQGDNPPEDSQFVEAYFNSNSSTYYLASDYIIRPFNRFHPFVGLEYGTMKSQFSGFKYKYSTAQGIETLTSPDFDAVRNRWMGMRLGAEYNLSKKFDLYMNVIARRSFERKVGNYFLLRPGIAYHLF